MTRLIILAVVSLATNALADSADRGIELGNKLEGRSATLLEGVTLASSFKPTGPSDGKGLKGDHPVRLLDDVRLSQQDNFPLDDGGGVDSDTRQVLALLLGLIVGFGTGHLVARDRDGFILFLIVDLVIVIASNVVWWAFGAPWFGWGWGLGGLALLVSHIIQGLDAYAHAGGTRLVDWTRQRTIEVAAAKVRPGSKDAFGVFAVSF
jgi:hypothetical protein